MKKIWMAALLLMALAAEAQDIQYNPTVDEIWAGRVFQEKDGKYYGTHRSNASTTWPTDDEVVMVYCLRVPPGHVRADAVLTPRSGKTVTLNLRVVQGGTGKEITTHTATLTSSTSTEQTVELMPDVEFPEDAWYRFEITSPKGSQNMSRWTKLRFQRASTLPVGDSEIFMAPSVHLNTFASTDPKAPGGDSYDWIYQEVMLPPQYEHPNTYAMVIGTNEGYSGIQSTLDNKGGYYHHVIFSVWDNGDTDKDPAMPEYLKSGVVDKGQDVIGVRFGGEGTGASARLTNGYWWTPGKWVQFLWNSRPENVTVTLRGHDGRDSLVNYQNTLESCWYKQEDETEWHYIATLRESGRNHHYGGFYSFLENFTDAGGELMRRAYYRNPSMRSLASGKWYARNSVTFSHTQGNSGDRLSRRDYGHGATELYPNCYYLQQGGYGEKCDSAQMLPLPSEMPWVDTIDVARLTARVDEALRREEHQQMLTRVAGCSKWDMRQWKVTAYSDEEREGEGSNGRAAQAVDGNQSTYWHTQYKPSKATFPHYLTLDAGQEVTVDGMTLTQEREEKYRARTIRVWTSTSGKMWTMRETLEVPNENNPVLHFTQPWKSQHWKVEIVNGYGTDLLVINELTMTCPADLDRLKELARTLLEEADRLGGYRHEDLKQVAEVYAEGACTDALALQDALNALSEAQSLKFGVVKKLQDIGTARCYQLHNKTRHGVLTSNETATEAVLVADGEENATDLAQGWMILRSEDYGCYYIYNRKAERYLSVRDGKTMLVTMPEQMDIRAVSGGFQLGTLTDVYELLDNYALAPDADMAYALLQQCELMPRLVEEMSTLCDEALEVYGEAFDYSVGKIDYAKASSRWTSNVNVTKNSSHPISHLCDGNKGTYYETWYSGIVWPEEKSYIQLQPSLPLQAFQFVFTPSQHADYGWTDMPKAITILASEDKQQWDEVARLTEGFPETIKQDYTSPVLSLGKKYSHIRFRVDQTQGNRDGGNHIFALAEMKLYAANPSATTSAYHRSEGVKACADSLTTLLEAAHEAVAAGNVTLEGMDELQYAIDDLRRALAEYETGISPTLDSRVTWSRRADGIVLKASQPTTCAVYSLAGQLLWSGTVQGSVMVKTIHNSQFIIHN